MSNTTDEEWAAALAAWNGLDQAQQQWAIGFIASAEPGLLMQAAGQAGPRTAPAAGIGVANTLIASLDSRQCREVLGVANTLIASLDGRQCREVLSVLATWIPAMVTTAIAEATGA